jgi:hypothetical protein
MAQDVEIDTSIPEREKCPTRKMAYRGPGAKEKRE